MSTVGLGQSYATLAAWQADAYGGNGAPYYAEVYAGADVGGIFYSEATEIFIDGHEEDRHNGVDEGTSGVAYTAGLFSFTYPAVDVTIRGLRFQGVDSGIGVDFYGDNQENQYSISQCLFVDCLTGNWITAPLHFNVYIGEGGSRHLFVDITNCVILNQTRNLDAAIGFIAIDEEGLTPDVEASFQLSGGATECTIIKSGGTMTYGVYGRTDRTQEQVNIVCKNTIILSATNCFGRTQVGGGVFLGGNNNLTTDATANSFSMTAGVVNQTAANVVTDVATDARLKVGSAAYNAGTNSGVPNFDIIGTARPQFALYDIGAFESLTNLTPAAATGRTGWIIGGAMGGNIIGG